MRSAPSPPSALPCVPQHTALPPEALFWVGGGCKCSKGAFTGEQFQLWAFLKAVPRVWKFSSGWGPWHGRSGWAQWCPGEPWAQEPLTLNNFTGALQGHSQALLPTWTQSPQLLLWGQVVLIYFEEAHHWQLGKGVSLPFDLWLHLKKMGCQNALLWRWSQQQLLASRCFDSLLKPEIIAMALIEKSDNCIYIHPLLHGVTNSSGRSCLLLHYQPLMVPMVLPGNICSLTRFHTAQNITTTWKSTILPFWSEKKGWSVVL